MLSTSTNPQCAANAVSFDTEDGIGFIGIDPAPVRSVPALLVYPVDRYLADGALFLPTAMEHKWAIFFHGGRIIFVRSWLREVSATAQVEVADNFATVTRINGAFVAEDEEKAFTVRVADYLLRTHALNIPFPALLPDKAGVDARASALWCMSAFGKMAEFATPHPIKTAPPSVPLRTHSLLHIAVARGNHAAAESQLDAGVPADLLARDGLAPLHWALANGAPAMAELLLVRGSPVDVRSAEAATPLMNAAQAGSVEWVEFLLARGADANARDARGFTALHRAAETGRIDVVRRLLQAGADPAAEAHGHTPLSLAQGRGETEIVRLLTRP
jgi:ankyrin repeat protein